MAWMTGDEPRNFTRMPNEPDMETLTYWVTRLEPLIRSDNQHEIIVVFCNRTGNEDDALYAGTSAVVGIHDGEVKVYGILGRGEKELLVVDTNDTPYAKLVYRPDADGPGVEATGTLEMQGDPGNSVGKNQSPDNPENHGDPRKPELVSSGHEDKQHQADANSKQNFLPPALPPTESATDLLKRRQLPSITIPQEPDLVKSNSARSPGTDSFNIPTPSSRSPMPMALRRLVIPESPPILAHQYPQDLPISAASLRSERSVQSFKSFTSSASNQTIRSNPRPPEESTPYPNTATPLSGYPSNAFTSNNGYYGDVNFDPGKGVYDPNTPFDDISPVSPTWSWRPSDSRMQTPSSVGPWSSGTPMWRRPEPFPWPAITSTSNPPGRTTGQNHTNGKVSQDLRQTNSNPLHPNNSSNQTTTSRVSQLESSVTSKRVVEVNANKERPVARPPSTKSRNASCSRVDGRSNSALGARDTRTPLSQQLDRIPRRVESVNKMRGEVANDSPCPDRPPSPKSRNCSRNRPNGDASFQQDDQFIQIAASLSLLDNEERNHNRQLSRVNHQQRSNSSTNAARTPNFGHKERSGTPNSANNVARPASRPVSRGRTPGPNVTSMDVVPHSTFSSAVRASSADSTRNDVLHSKVQGRESQSRQSQSGRTSSTRNSRRPSQSGDSADFERVEVIVGPSCPVHGRNPSSDRPRPRDVSMPGIRSSPRNFRTDNLDINTGAFQGDELRQTRRSQMRRDNSQATRESSETHVGTNPYHSVSNLRAEMSDYHSPPESIQTLPTLGGSPATLFNFDPATPRAMVLMTDDSDVESLPNGNLDSEIAPATRCADSDPVHTFNLPVGSVMS